MIEIVTSIFEAIQVRSLERVRRSLLNLTSLESRNKQEQTTVHFAAMLGYEEIVAEIIRHGANLETQDEDGATPLISSAALGRVEIVSQLLRAGASADGPPHTASPRP